MKRYYIFNKITLSKNNDQSNLLNLKIKLKKHVKYFEAMNVKNQTGLQAQYCAEHPTLKCLIPDPKVR